MLVGARGGKCGVRGGSGSEEERVDTGAVVAKRALRLGLWLRGIGAGGEWGGEVRGELRGEYCGAGRGDKVFRCEGCDESVFEALMWALGLACR